MKTLKYSIYGMLLSSLFLLGCGQRGGLYLPPKNPSPPTHVPVAP